MANATHSSAHPHWPRVDCPTVTRSCYVIVYSHNASTTYPVRFPQIWSSNSMNNGCHQMCSLHRHVQDVSTIFNPSEAFRLLIASHRSTKHSPSLPIHVHRHSWATASVWAAAVPCCGCPSFAWHRRIQQHHAELTPLMLHYAEAKLRKTSHYRTTSTSP